MNMQEFAEAHPEQALLLRQMELTLTEALRLAVEVVRIGFEFAEAERRGDLKAAELASHRATACREQSEKAQRQMRELAGILMASAPKS